MSDLIASSHNTLIVGLGVTGVSVARYLTQKGKPFWVADTQPKVEVLDKFKADFPSVEVLIGAFDYQDWHGVAEIVLSPGVPRSHPAIVAALENGISVIGDIELFVREAKAPIVAITGSNGKTTVTTMVGEMAGKFGLQVSVGGNIGTPSLDLLNDAVELYVLELSSFQLESVNKLGAEVAVVLNVTPDHLDRYNSFQDYHFAKQRIYFGAKMAVANRDDLLTQPPLSVSTSLTLFGTAEPDLKDYGLRVVDEQLFLSHGLTNLLPVADLKIRGSHNYSNALAALAIGHAAGFDDGSMVEVLKSFSGLPHRCQLAGNVNGVDYINDSKATNLGATLAALFGLSCGGANPDNADLGIILIAGGDGKGTDFSKFGEELPEGVKAVIVIGSDGPKIYQSCQKFVNTFSCDSLIAAVAQATEIAHQGDIVLLSPACASMDMFKNYEDRGQQFIQAVEALCQR